MTNMRKTPSRGSSSSGGGSSPFTPWGLVIILAILIGVVVSCSVPLGRSGTDTNDCEWELKRDKLHAQSLRWSVKSVNSTVGTFQLASYGEGPRPKPGKGYHMPTRKAPRNFHDPIKKVKPKKKPVRMPAVRPHKPSTVRKGYHWVYDCD